MEKNKTIVYCAHSLVQLDERIRETRPELQTKKIISNQDIAPAKQRYGTFILDECGGHHFLQIVVEPIH